MASEQAWNTNLHATSVAKQMVDEYTSGKSIPQIACSFGVPRSTVRLRLIGEGVVLRGRVEAMTKAKREGRGISPMAGRHQRTPEMNEKIRAAKLAHGDLHAVGFCKRQDGYMEITRGEEKGRPVHVVVMEKAIGHRIPDGFVVHHVDGKKDNNDIGNLAIMTRAGHARLHAFENLPKRQRDELGRLV